MNELRKHQLYAGQLQAYHHFFDPNHNEICYKPPRLTHFFIDTRKIFDMAVKQNLHNHKMYLLGLGLIYN